jgi:integrase
VADQRDLLGKPFKAATVKQYLLALSHVFTTAIREWQWTDTNPVLLVNKPRDSKLRIRFLSDDERRQLLEACKVSANPYLYTLVVLALSTGARRMELLTLKWDDVDLGRSMITLHDTKNKERRALPVTGLALELMRQHAKVRRIDSDLVFPRRDGQAPIGIEAHWQTARQAVVAAAS